MAQLQFPDPNTTTTYTQAGITWTWNSTLGVWSTDANEGLTETAADSKYLRKDSAAGAQTVETTSNTTFNGNIIVGGDVSLSGGGGPTEALQRQEIEALIAAGGGGGGGGGGGTITGVTAGDGLNGGGTIGPVTLDVDDTVVRTSGSQTIGGEKKFIESVVVGQSSGATSNIRNYVKFGRNSAPKAAIGFINNSANGRGDILFMNNNVSDGTSFSDSDERMRISADGSVNIKGLTTFEAGVIAGNNPVNGATNGARLLNSGQFVASNGTGSNKIFKGFKTGDSTETSSITAAGALTLAGGCNASRVTATGGNIIAEAGDVRASAGDPNSGNATGVRLTTGGLIIATNATGNNDIFRGYIQGQSAKKISFTAFGQATFAASLTASKLRTTNNSDENYFPNPTIHGPSDNPGPNTHQIYIGNAGSLGVYRSTTTPAANPCLTLSRNNPSANTGWRAIEFYIKGDKANGQPPTSFIKCDGSQTRIIDSRLGATGVAMADGAADIVKLLQPKVITQGGETFNGFLPADLVGTFAAAVDGTAGATLDIGTYTDPDGNVETEVEEPQSIPFGATWVQTGTRDVMQGVSRGELIPLLTKALQEALARIEALEAQVNP